MQREAYYSGVSSRCLKTCDLEEHIPADKKDVRAAHNAAFQYLRQYVNDNIIKLGTVG